jgi:hypothetical protein
MRFVEFWHGIAEADPEWLYFDSKAAPYPELSKLNQRGVWFITIRPCSTPHIAAINASDTLMRW